MSFLIALLGIIPPDLLVPSQTAPPVPFGVTLYFASGVTDFRKITDTNYNHLEAAPTSILVAKLSGGKYAIILSPMTLPVDQFDPPWIILSKNASFQADEAVLTVHWWHIIDGQLQSFHVKLQSTQDFQTFVQCFKRNSTEGSPETDDNEDESMEDEVEDLYGNFRACIEYGAFDERLTHAWGILYETRKRIWATTIGYVLMYVLFKVWKALAAKDTHEWE